MATFKKKTISPQAVALAVEGAAHAPIIGDPRISPAATDAPRSALIQTANLGSSQDWSDGIVGQIIEVPVTRVKSNPFNPRAVYTNAAVDEMAVSMQTNGQRVSALGFYDGEGNVILIEGETRLRGARVAGLETLRIELRPKPASERELYEIARAANVERNDQTPLDDAIRWKELLAKKVYPTQVALANALNVKEDHVSRVLSLASLPQRIVITCSETPELLNTKMLNAIREFWEQEGDEKTVELIREVSKEGWGYRDVVLRRKASAKGPVRRTRSAREAVSYMGATGEIKTFDEDGRLELSLKGLTPENAASIANKIKALLVLNPHEN